MPFKNPVSALVVVHTVDLHVLLLERAAHPGFWQSVTGSREGNESLAECAARELAEETGIVVAPSALRAWTIVNRFEILPLWRHRYAEGITHNLEHVFSLQLPAPVPVTLAAHEHSAYQWLPWQVAAPQCFSWTNRDAINMLGLNAANQHLL